MNITTEQVDRAWPGRRAQLKRQLLKLAGLLTVLLLGLAPGAWAQCEQLVWQDEFNGPSLDLTKWEREVNGSGQGTGQLDYATDRPENSFVDGGYLNLKLIKEEYKGLHYTSGRLRTYKKLDTQYGRIEARVKGVYSQGNGFAFWMLGSDYETVTWPKCGEIDIFENTGKYPGHNIGTAHFAGPTGQDAISQGAYDLPAGQRWADDFHVTGIEWSPTYIKWYIDGVVYHTLDLTQPLSGYRPFNRPFFVLLSIGEGGGYSGPPDATTVTPMTAYVDYVRVYKSTYSTFVSGDEKVYKGEQNKQYTVSTTSDPSNTYAWTVPTGARILAGQGTPSINVDWGQVAGPVSVAIKASCNSTANTYALNVGVEEPFVADKVYETFESPPAFTYTTLSGSLSKGVPNPQVGVVNPSARVGKYIRNAQAQYDVIGLQGVNLSPAGDFVTGQRRVLLDVYADAPVGTRVTLNFENSKAANAGNYPTGRYATFEARTTRQNQWETLEFAYTGTPDQYAGAADVDQLILMFAPVTYTGNVYYFDNLRTGQPGGTPRVLDSKVLENFDGTSQLTLDTSLTGTSGTYSVGANPAKTAPNPSATAAKYVRNAGAQYDALVYRTTAISDGRPFRLGTSRVQLDMYTDAPVGTKLSLNFEISTIATGANYPAGRYATFEAVTTKQNQWETLPFALSLKPDAGASDAAIDKLVFLFNPVSNTSNSYYIDNLQVVSTAPKENLVLASTWLDYDANNNLTLKSATGTYSPAVANPAPAAPNTSANVAKYVRNASQQYDAILFNKSTAGIDPGALKNRTQRIAIDVYTSAPAGTPITVGLDATSLETPTNYPTGRHSNYLGTTTVQNAWHTVYFTLGGQPDVSAPDNLVDAFAILFESGASTGTTYYFDNIRVLNVVPQPTLTSLVVTPALSQNVATGAKVQYAVQGKDQFGNNIAAGPVAWSVSGGGSLDTSGLFTAAANGAFKVYAKTSGLTGTADVLVGQGVGLTTLTVDPSATFVYQGSSLPLTVRGYDQTGAAVTATPTWTVTGAPGVTVSSSGVVTASSSATGTASVKATSGALSATATLTVRTPPAADSLTISPVKAKVYLGDALQFAATAFDQYRNPYAATYAWSVSGGGSIDATGLFASTTLGSFVVKVQAGAAIASTYVSVVPKPANLALGKPTRASSVQGTLAARYATDGTTTATSPDTRWSSLPTDTEWIRVDLGQKYDLSRVVLYWEAAYGKIYDIQVADDTLQTRRLAYHEPAGDGNVDNLTSLAAGTAGRYVWLSGTGRGTPYGYSLYELEVYGLPHQDPALKSIIVTPNFSSVASGKSVAFSAASLDQFGNAFAAPPTWTASGGSISSAGVFTAAAAGTYTITATAGGVSGSASLTVTGSGSTPTVNLALNKPVVVSTTENGGTPGPNAVDGNGGTRWASAAADPQWLYVDLQARYTISQVVLNWETASGKAYQLQVSDDAQTWTTLYATTTGPGGVEKLTPTSTGTGRYLRLYGTARNTGYGYSLWELEVYGTAATGGTTPALASLSVTPGSASIAAGATQQFAAQGKDQNGNNFATTPTWTVSGGASISSSGVFAAATAGSYTVTATSGSVQGTATVTVTSSSPNLALRKPVRASSVENYGTPAVNAVDGDGGTRWSSAATDAQWLRVDLGATYSVNRVKLTWETAYGKDYAVETSADTVNWTPLKTVTGNTSLTNDLTGLSGSGRYVRLRGISRATGYGYSLYELEVYGTAVASAKATAAALVAKPDAASAANSELTLYPNPAGASTTLAGVAAYPATVRVYDVRGSLLQTAELTGPAQPLDVTPLAAGWYVLRVSSPGQVQTQRLLKQ